ncbi:MAG: hypothetical protein EBZ78_04820 [Verrucomicrobia bacterium]|nr:hypothetical protein [Verrucomicrobiota bacterium]
MPARADRRIAAVATAAGVSERTARRWRDTGDERFARHVPDRIKVHSPGTAAAASEPTDEVGRLQKLASDLAARINLDDAESRSDLISDYTKTCEALRKMRGDRPGFEEQEGKMVAVDEADKLLAARDAALIPLLRGLSFRLAPVCVGRTAAEIQGEIEAEVGQIMRQVQAAI